MMFAPCPFERMMKFRPPEASSLAKWSGRSGRSVSSILSAVRKGQQHANPRGQAAQWAVDARLKLDRDHKIPERKVEWERRRADPKKVQARRPRTHSVHKGGKHETTNSHVPYTYLLSLSYS